MSQWMKINEEMDEMSWEPDVNTGDNIPKGGKLLEEARASLGDVIIETLSDDNGVFGYVTNNCVLVAKNYIWGNLVSAHKKAVISSINTNKKLVMYIGRNKAFYSFEPHEILNNSEENTRLGSVMLNFNIRLGKRYGGA